MNIINLRENILSALPLSMAKEYEMMNRELNTNKNTTYYKTFKKLFDKAFGKDEKGRMIYRKYINIDNMPIDKEIQSFLKDNGYSISEEEFNAGIIIKNKDDKNNHLSLEELQKKGMVLRIGKILNKKKAPSSLILKWDKISKEISNKKLIVISRHPYDIAGQSTDRSWESCMTLPTDKQYAGDYCDYVDSGIKAGVLVAYLISNDDKNINKPLARVLIKPYLNEDKNKAYFTVSRVYGTAGNEFRKSVQKWLDKNLNKRLKEEEYYLDTNNIYRDSENSRAFYIKKVKEKYRPKTKEELLYLIDEVNLADIDTSLITDMSELFYRVKRSKFTGLENWNVSNVTTMKGMFEASNFNGDISKWNTRNVEDMEGMFKYSKFNGDISKWNVSNVRSMKDMFAGSIFNGDISKWDTSNVINMEGMFYESEFNGDISNWNVSNVTSMYGMFYFSEFNGDISNWNVSNVEDMNGMFKSSKFNGDISKWNVSNVKDMEGMFYNTKFNGDISKWDTRNVQYMYGMFGHSPLNKRPPKWYKK